MDELLHVKNLSDDDFVGVHQGKTTRISKGQEAIVPSAAAVLWFGDPTAIDHVVGNDLHEDRTKECERLDARYGIFPIRMDELGKVPAKTREEAWPKVAVKDLQNEEIRMVIHDPTGASVTPATESLEERSLLLKTIEDMRKRVEAMEAEAARGVPEGELVVDTPQSRSRGRAS